MKNKLPKKSLILARLLANPYVLKRLKSPRIYRNIPVKLVSWTILNNPLIYVGFASGIILFFILTSGLRLIDNTQKLSEMKKAREQVASEIAFWQEAMRKHPDYRDGYFRLAVLEYRIGNEEKAREYLDKTLELDPNFAKGREFLKEIE